MIGLLWRLVGGRRLRWLLAGTVARQVLRRSASRSVDRATADIEDRLPETVRRALDVVPADATRAGGSAVVAARTAKRVATGSRAATRAVNERRRKAADRWQRIRSIGAEIGTEAEVKRRELTADYLRATDRPDEADDALLDLRPAGGVDALDDRDDPMAAVSDPVRPGRRRARPPRRPPPVNRVQRSYRPRSMPWDR